MVGLIALAFAGLTLSSPQAGSAERSGAPAGEPAFQSGQLDLEVDLPTSLAFGPDGRLYVASLTEIRAVTIDPATKDVLDVELVASGLEDVVGIAFDPTAPASPVTLYASRREHGAIDGFESRVSKFTAPTWEREDVITGLPTSRPFLNHLTNGLAFDQDGRLFIAQGSSTDAGIAVVDDDPDYWPETPLSAAILVADIQAPGFDGDITYSPAASPTDHSVDLVSGDVVVYASGLRNPYDLVLHSNGYIYAADNGPFNPGYSASCTEDAIRTSAADELNLVEEGGYYGHPNRNRGRFDERQCTYHAPEEGSGDDFTGPIAVLPNHCSCDGIVEYTGTAFDSAMLGDLLYVEWSRGNLSRAILSTDGRSVLSISALASGFYQPLDVTVGPDGTIYIAEFGGSRVSYLRPDPESGLTPTLTPTPTPTSTAATTATPTVTPTATPSPTPLALAGDVSCDGQVNSIDAALVLQFVAALLDDLACPESGDVNGDGLTNAVDASLILQLEAGVIDSLPP